MILPRCFGVFQKKKSFQRRHECLARIQPIKKKWDKKNKKVTRKAKPKDMFKKCIFKNITKNIRNQPNPTKKKKRNQPNPAKKKTDPLLETSETSGFPLPVEHHDSRSSFQKVCFGEPARDKACGSKPRVLLGFSWVFLGVFSCVFSWCFKGFFGGVVLGFLCFLCFLGFSKFFFWDDYPPLGPPGF